MNTVITPKPPAPAKSRAVSASHNGMQALRGMRLAPRA
jgi:hypothetical protein